MNAYHTFSLGRSHGLQPRVARKIVSRGRHGVSAPELAVGIEQSPGARGSLNFWQHTSISLSSAEPRCFGCVTFICCCILFDANESFRCYDLPPAMEPPLPIYYDYKACYSNTMGISVANAVLSSRRGTFVTGFRQSC